MAWLDEESHGMREPRCSPTGDEASVAEGLGLGQFLEARREDAQGFFEKVRGHRQWG